MAMREWNCGPEDEEDEDDLDATGVWQLPAALAFEAPDADAEVEGTREA
jgi:hypothetical protein